MLLSLFHLVIAILVIAFCWLLFSKYVLPKVPEPFQTLLVVILAIAAIYWLLSLVNMVSPLTWKI